jgi:hypothetical protein
MTVYAPALSSLWQQLEDQGIDPVPKPHWYNFVASNVASTGAPLKLPWPIPHPLALAGWNSFLPALWNLMPR